MRVEVRGPGVSVLRALTLEIRLWGFGVLGLKSQEFRALGFRALRFRALGFGVLGANAD